MCGTGRARGNICSGIVMNTDYQVYFDALPCSLPVQDRDFRIIDANQRFRTDFGDIDGRTGAWAYAFIPAGIACSTMPPFHRDSPVH